MFDLEDPLSAEITLEDFLKTYGVAPLSPRYRIMRVEVLTCPEDNQPILASECGHCPRFVRRLDNFAYFRKQNLAELDSA